MAFETGRTFDPAKRNPASGALGLIQFMPNTIAGVLHTTPEVLARKTPTQQLSDVETYLLQYRGRIRTFTDTYMAILWPAAVGLPDETVIFASGKQAYLLNRGLDLNKDGAVTKAEACSLVERLYEEGLQEPNVFETETDAAPEPLQAPPQPREAAMPTVALSLLQGIIPQVLTLFSGRAQADISRATGASPDAAAAFMQSLIGKVGEVAGVPVTDDRSAVQAVAAVTANPDPAKVQALEDHSLDFIDKMAPLLDKLMEIQEREVKVSDASADAASVRTDSAKVRQQFQSRAWWALTVGALLIGLIASLQVYLTDDHTADAAITGAMIFAFGQIVAWIGLIAHYGYGSSGSSGAKDAVIGQLAKGK